MAISYIFVFLCLVDGSFSKGTGVKAASIISRRTTSSLSTGYYTFFDVATGTYGYYRSGLFGGWWWVVYIAIFLVSLIVILVIICYAKC